MRLAFLAALLRSGRVPDGHNKGTTRILESWPIGMILAALLLSGCASAPCANPGTMEWHEQVPYFERSGWYEDGPPIVTHFCGSIGI